MIRPALYRLMSAIVGPPEATIRVHGDAGIVVARCRRCGACAVFGVAAGQTKFRTDHDCPGLMVPIVVKDQEKEALWPSG